MARFYTFKQWLDAHPELRRKIIECPHCDYEAEMECPDCHAVSIAGAPCETCRETGRVECRHCIGELAKEYKAQMEEDERRYRLAMRVAL